MVSIDITDIRMIIISVCINMCTMVEHVVIICMALHLEEDSLRHVRLLGLTYD